MRTEVHNTSRGTLLVLGAGLMQVPVIAAARRMGYCVAAADADTAAVGVRHADKFWHIDLKNTSALVKKAQAESICAVLTAATDFTHAVSQVAKAVGLPGLPEDVARNANFKQHMRRCFSAAGVPSPKHAALNPAAVTDSAECARVLHAAELYFPVVVKPADSMGARGVITVRDERELAQAVRDAARYSASDTVIIERMLEGPELSVDSFIAYGKCLPVGIADRHIVFAPYCVETGHSIPSRAPAYMRRDAIDVLQSAARALGIHNGVCKGDIIFDGGKAHIGECASRLSGGYMSGWTIPLAYGIDPAEYAVEIAGRGLLSTASVNALNNVGNHTVCTTENTRCVAERAILALPGILQSVHVPHDMQNIPVLPCDEKQNTVAHSRGVTNVIITAHEGARRVLPKNNTDKSGSVIASAATHKAAARAAAEAVCRVYCHVTPDDETHMFLYDNSPAGYEKYHAWFCYPVLCREFGDVCKQSITTLTAAVKTCAENYCIRLYIPPRMRKSSAYNTEGGAWTHGYTMRDALEMFTCYYPNRVRYVDSIDKSINALALNALLKGGWQGLHYTIQLLQGNAREVFEIIRLCVCV